MTATDAPTRTGTRLPTYAISHGGGPWPWIKEMLPGDHTPLEESLQAIPTEIGTVPRAVLMVSAHWETDEFTVQSHPAPPMLYDYGGFPDFTYHLQYPAPGSPEVAAEVVELLTAAGIPIEVEDRGRGFDHGVFVPLAVAYPDADVPVVQFSVRRDFDPVAHLAVGRAMAPLRDRGVLIVGSGFPSYHDLSNFGSGAVDPSREFDAWLTETMVGHVGPERSHRLRRWSEAPSARLAHPREEHLIPLLVAVGAAEGEAGVRQYHQERFMGAVNSSAYRLGEVA
ncbi:MAG: class III extradiol ring-cleavage dioxygenase [Actinomycetota bacterium]